MRVEIPTCRRCCLCLPLRYGLLTWGYFRLIVASLILIGVSFVLNRFIMMNVAKYGYAITTSDIVLFSIAIPLLVTDIAIGIMFIIGCHTKNANLLTKYYQYSIFLVSLFILLSLYNVVTSIIYLTESKPQFPYIFAFVLLDLLTLFAYIVIQIYIILLTRSEVLKLKNSCQFQFENNAAEAELSLRNMDSEGEKKMEDNKPALDKDGVITAEVKIGMTNA